MLAVDSMQGADGVSTWGVVSRISRWVLGGLENAVGDVVMADSRVSYCSSDKIWDTADDLDQPEPSNWWPTDSSGSDGSD